MIFSRINDWLKSQTGGLPNWIITLTLLGAAAFLIHVALLKTKRQKIDTIFNIV